MKLLRRIISWASDNTIVHTAFIFFAMALFLGDGKQTFVDVFGSLIILILYGIAFWKKTPARPVSKTLVGVWVCFFVYIIGASFFSDSIGYSISSIVRWVEAFLMFVFFYQYGSAGSLEVFEKDTIIFGVGATIVSFVFLLFPTLTTLVALPKMNLLYANYGHNHLADILFFVLPIAFFRYRRSPTFYTIGTFLFIVIGFLFTFARGAWALAILGLICMTIADWKRVKSTLSPVFIGLFYLTLVILSIFFVSWKVYPHTQSSPPNFWERLIIKPSVVNDNRWNYWGQAIEAVKERPLFGSGPGTFYLESKRLQKAPFEYSWYAHNFILENLVELGTVGTGLVVLVFVLGMYLGIKNNPHSSLLWSIGLTFVYSFYEFNLNFLVVWLLLFAALGVLSGPEKKQKELFDFSKSVVFLALFVLLLFYLTSMGSLVAEYFGNTKLAYLLSPYDANRAIAFFHDGSNPNDATGDQLVFMMHKKNPDVYESFLDKSGQIRYSELINKRFLKIIRLDPLNFSNKKMYVSFLLYNNQEGPLNNFINSELGAYTKPIWLSYNAVLVYKKGTIAKIENENNERLYFSKFFYIVAMEAIKQNPRKAVEMVKNAIDLTPSNGYLYAEAASIYSYLLHDDVGALDMMTRCQQNIRAWLHCKQIVNNMGRNPPPGGLQKEVLSFQ